MCPSAPRVCREPGGQKPVLSLSLDLTHRSPVNSLHKGKWRGALMFSLICAWINSWINNHEAGDLRRNRAHYDVIVMHTCDCFWWHFCKHLDLDYRTLQFFSKFWSADSQLFRMHCKAHFWRVSSFQSDILLVNVISYWNTTLGIAIKEADCMKKLH